jgi:hypothetical protein
VTSAAGRALVAFALLVSSGHGVGAQETVAVPVRHVLAFDVARLVPFRHVYDMIVQTRDSAVVVGERQVTLSAGTYDGADAWVLVESRTGVVPAVETLYVTPAMHPLLWNSVLGHARLGATFVGDTVIGATSTPAGRQNLIVAARSDLLVSQSMVEMLLPLLPLTAQWSDSASVLAVDAGAGTVIPVELAVVAEENVLVDSITERPSWVVAMRAETKTILFWVDKESGDVHRTQQPLPAHTGSLLEYRRRPDAPASR